MSTPIAATVIRTGRVRRMITFETYAHLVPGYLHAQIDRLPKLEKFAALVLHEAPKPPEPARGQLPDRPDFRAVLVVRLAGVEPAARGFEGRCSIQLSYRRVRGVVCRGAARVKPAGGRPGNSVLDGRNPRDLERSASVWPRAGGSAGAPLGEVAE